MSWSDPEQIVVKSIFKIVTAKPSTFTVVGAAVKKKSGKK